MSIKVVLGKQYNREAVVIDPNASAGDIEDKEKGIYRNANNIIGKGQTSRQILSKLYGTR